jgi:hypothetical protein
MTTLGVTVTQRSTPPSRGTFSQTGTAFKAGKSNFGPVGEATKLQSIADFAPVYGARDTANQVFYDSVDTAFQEGASVVYAVRIVGPGAAVDTINLAGSSGTALVWTATNPGASAVKLQVTNGTDGTTRIVKVLDAATNTVIAQTAQFSDRTAVVGALGPGTITDGGGTGLPAVAAATAPTGGTSDLGAVTSAEVQDATDLFLKSYGPGQLSADGVTVAGTPDVLDAHAKANDRFALLDIPDTTTQSTITTYMGTLTDQESTYSAFFGPWGQAPGVNNSPVSRNVPASAWMAGLCARVDAAGNPNRAAMGFDFALEYVQSLNTEYDDATLQSLYDQGLNLAQTYYGVLINKGFRTLADSGDDPVHYQANAARLRMFITAAAGPIGAAYFGKPINDGTETAFASDLEVLLKTLADNQAIYPADSNWPYSADASTHVNQPGTVAQGLMIGVVNYTPTTAAIGTQIQLAPIPVTV